MHASDAWIRQEAIMLAPLTLEPIALAARCMHRIESARGTEVACVHGATWVTQERDPRDLVLLAGESLVLETPGLALVYALKDAVITVGAARHLPAAGQGRALCEPEQACA
jgi:hypothetical protein